MKILRYAYEYKQVWKLEIWEQSPDNSYQLCVFYTVTMIRLDDNENKDFV